MKKRRVQLQVDNIQDDDEDDPKQAMVMPASTNSRVLDGDKLRQGLQKASSSPSKGKKGISFGPEAASERDCILRESSLPSPHQTDLPEPHSELSSEGDSLMDFLKNKRSRGPMSRLELKNLITRFKIQNIVRTFISKLKRNNTYRRRPEGAFEFERESEEGWRAVEGIEFSETFQRCYEGALILVNVFLIYFFTLNFAYPLYEYETARDLNVFCLLCITVDFLLNFITVKIVAGVKVTKVVDISQHYLQDEFAVDLVLIFLMVLSLSVQSRVIEVLKLLILLKIPSCLDRLEKLEVILIETAYKERYWELTKIFLFNFCFAHVLALFLTFMAEINPSDNWMTMKGIRGAPWYELYIWSYYWAVNIMLTVGFGDIHASSWQEAACLIFIESISCLVLAYNINCVGTLVKNIRHQDQEKSKHYKTFMGLTKKHDISNELFLRISNYIEESNEIRKRFNIEEENGFIEQIPKSLKKDFHKEANKSIFQNLFFFANLADLAIQNLAQSIEVRVTHPEELILTRENFLTLCILKEGSVGYCCRKAGCDFNGTVVERVEVRAGQNPFLMGLEFLHLRPPNYEIKSLEYSFTYNLPYEGLVGSLMKSCGDYEYFCFLRDKHDNEPDEFEILRCEHCLSRHTKFTCPALHYLPFREHLIGKSLQKHKNKKNRRERGFVRRAQPGFKSLQSFLFLNEEEELKVFTDKNFQEIQNNRSKMFFVDQLKQMASVQKKESLSALEYSLNQQDNASLEATVLQNTADNIRLQLTNFLRREQCEDGVWEIELDLMENYKSYFPLDNPCLLRDMELARQAPDLPQQREAGLKKDTNTELSYRSYRSFQERRQQQRRTTAKKQRRSKEEMEGEEFHRNYNANALMHYVVRNLPS